MEKHSSGVEWWGKGWESRVNRHVRGQSRVAGCQARGLGQSGGLRKGARYSRGAMWWARVGQSVALGILWRGRVKGSGGEAG